MKDSDEVRVLVDEWVNKYSEQIGLIRKPIIVYEKKELPENLQKVKVRLKSHLAVSFVHKTKQQYTYLNIEDHADQKELENTIVHELTHLRFPHFEHEGEFHERVGMILMGKRFPIMMKYPKGKKKK